MMWATILAMAVQTGAPAAPLPRTTEPLTFASDIRMIRLDVSVVDGHGRPVRGLGVENFSVLENGKPVELSFFEAMEDGALATSVRGEDSPGMSLAVRAETPSPGGLGQRIVIVTDPGPLTPMQLARVRQATSDFILHQAKDRDIVRLVNLATRQVWEGLIPNDRMRLASVGRVISRQANPLFKAGGDGDTIAEQIDLDMEEDVREAYSQSTRSERFLTQFARTGELLGLFDEILVQLAGVPGRKSLILVSGGFPQFRQLDERLERTAHLAREAQAAIHFVDAFGLDGLLPEGAGQKMRPIFEMAWERSGGSQDLAEATGGFVSRFANVLTSALTRAAEEARSYYIVGYVPRGKDDGRFRSLKVRVNRDDVTVRTKKGYIAGGIDRGLVSRRVH
jgi:VWFA-related protein